MRAYKDQQVTPNAKARGTESPLRGILLPLTIFLFLALSLVVVGLLRAKRQMADAQNKARADLAAVAALKSEQIENWLRERTGDAKIIRENPVAARRAAEFFRSLKAVPGSSSYRTLKQEIAAWMESRRRNYEYEALFLLDASGALHLTAGPAGEALHAFDDSLVTIAAHTRDVVFGDLQLTGDSAEVRLDIVAPMLLPDNGTGVVIAGFVVLRVDPRHFLFPLIRSWPTPSRTAETLLFRREGDAILYLNDLRHREGTALRFRRPLQEPDLPPARAGRGEDRIVEGVDYRGINVLAAIQRIPGTPWFMMAKIDTEEVLGPFEDDVRNTMVIFGMLILLSGAGTVLFWRWQHSQHYKELYELELGKRLLSEHFDYLTKYANDIIFLTDDSLRIVDVNERAVQAYGYSREELIGADVRILRTEEEMVNMAEHRRMVDLQNGAVFETVHRKRDGSVFPVESSVRVINVEGRKFYQAIVRDITERKKAEDEIVRLSRIYAVLSDVNQLIVRTHDEEELFKGICRIGVEIGRFRLVWIGLAEKEGKIMRVRSHCGHDDGYLDQISISLDKEDPRSKGPTGIAFREGRTVLAQDIENNEMMKPWREEALRRGYRSSAAIPLNVSGTIAGTIQFYSSEPHFFDTQEVRLLEELVSDVSFALESMQQNRERVEAELKLRNIIEHSTNLFYSHTPDHKLTYVSPQSRDFFDCEPEEAMIRWTEFLTDHPLNKMGFELTERAIRTGQPQPPYELELKTRRGRTIWVEVREAPVVEDGRTVAMVGSLTDITLRKQAEEALRRSEERFRRLAENAQDVIYRYRFTPDRGFEYVSPSATAVTGYSPAEHYADPDLGMKIVHPEDRPLLQHILEGEGFGKALVLRWIRKDGGVIWTEQRNVPIYDQDGRLVAIEGIARDITERMRMEETMRLQSTVLNAAANAIVITDKNATIEFVNPAFTALTGYTLSEAVGRNPKDLVKSGVHDKSFYQSMWETILAGHVWKGEMVNRTKDGRLYTEEQTITPVVGNDGVITHFVSIKQDITERKKAEQSLKDSESRLSAFFEATLDGVIVEQDDRVVFANKAGARIFGYDDPAEMAGKPMRELQAEEEWERLHGYSRARERDESAPTRYEFRGKRKDGALMDLELAVSMFRISGEPYIISIVRDITDRKKAEEQIREQAALLDNASDGIVVRDLENHILFWNKGAERMYGWSRDEILGRLASDFLYTEGVDSFPDISAMVLATGEWEGELEHTTKAGKNITVRSHWTLMKDQAGRPKSIMTVNTDITEQKAFEGQVLRTQRLESLGTLAGGIAHDLNNVLAPILLSFEAIRRKIRGDEKTLQLLSVAESSAQRGKNIIGQVLAFARGIEGVRGPIQIRHLIKECEEIIRETFPKSITLRTSIPKDLWAISADATQIHQVCMNLVVNARDAMPQGGTLTISASNLRLDREFASMRIGAHEGPYVVIEVSDTGVGIPKEHLDRIFDPFFTTKEVGKGTGLGLSTVHTIITAHNGFIDVSSTPGYGSTFKVYLPAVDASDHGSVNRKEDAFPKGNNEMILIVDDEASVRDITAETLQMFDYRVLVAANGVEAVAQFAEHANEIAVTLMDLMMPVMDGPSAIRAIRNIRPDATVIASSGLVPGEGQGPLEGLRVQAVLQKPYTAEQLLRTIHDVLEKQ